MEELRESEGLAAARFVKAWRSGELLRGKRVEMQQVDGQRYWRMVNPNADAEPAEEVSSQERGIVITEETDVVEEELDLVPTAQPEETDVVEEVSELAPAEPDEPEETEAAEGEPELEPGAPRLEDSKIHGRTVNGLVAAGLETSADVVAFIDDAADADAAVERLTEIDGVGQKGAADVIAWVQFVEDWTGAGADPETFGALEVGDEFLATSSGKRFLKVEPSRRENGTPYNALRCFEFDGDERTFFAADSQIDAIPGGDIHCPECGGWFDRAPFDAYEAGSVAVCEADGDPDRGDCGVRFCISGFLDGEWVVVGMVETEIVEEAVKHAIDANEVESLEEESLEEESLEVESLEEEPLEVESLEEEEDSADDLSDIDFTFADVGNEDEPDTESSQVEPLEEPTAEPFSLDAFWGEPDAELVPEHERLHPALSACRPASIIPEAPDSDEWLRLRAHGVGSSDAGAILGVSPHASALDIWKTKVGEDADSKPWLEPYSDFGTWFEPFLLDYCELTSGRAITAGDDLGTLRSVIWPRAQANLDGLDDLGVIEELKTSSEIWDEVPPAYVAQAQHQMYVTGCDEARVRQFICPVDRPAVMKLLERGVSEQLVAEWLFDVGEVVTWVVERDDDYIARLVELEQQFWACVEAGVEPIENDPDGEIDLTDDPKVFAAMKEFAALKTSVAVYKPEMKAVERAKKKARKEIERAVSLLKEKPKRVVVGDHKATLVERYDNQYWNLYPGEEHDRIIF
jgi:putative phage-type endonuclease